MKQMGISQKNNLSICRFKTQDRFFILKERVQNGKTMQYMENSPKNVKIATEKKT
jgi:hypothetical protein